MTTLLIGHPDCLQHEPPAGHPERPDRLRAIDKVMEAEMFEAVMREEAPTGDLADLEAVHPEAYVELIRKTVPANGAPVRLDPDTFVSKGSWSAALRGIGAVTRAVDAVMAGEAANAFCAVRPPGHHAETVRAMGFCLFNNAAIAARHARRAHGIDRVAIVDFDVHHGNGTQEIFWDEPEVLYASTHQMPLYPGTGHSGETGRGNIFNAPLRAGDGGAEFRQAMGSVILPALHAFKPELVVVSAGFDAHRDDPLAALEFTEEDFAWATLQLVGIADRYAEGRLVSTLEGGYDLVALARSVATHVRVLMEA